MMNSPVQEQTKQASEMSTKIQAAWTGIHMEYGLYQTETVRSWVLLDNQSSAIVCSNKDMVSNIRIPENGESWELHTYGGIMITTLKCNVPDFGEAWFNPEANTNIFSYAEMAKKYRIASDSKHDYAFTVRLPNKKV
jgi:hypothetical protein